MGTMQPEKAPKRELDDSGCVQDGSSPLKKCPSNGYVGSAQLLDLSDDVLLVILQYCSPMDLKALGFTCPRLGSLIRDRSLWQRVNAVGTHTGRRRLYWMLANTLHAGTERLLIEGYAYKYPGCMGHVNKSETADGGDENEAGGSGSGDGPSSSDREQGVRQPPYPLNRQHARMHISTHPLPRFSASPSWCEEYAEEEAQESNPGQPPQCPGQPPQCPGQPQPQPQPPPPCPGPVFTLSPSLLTRLRMRCPNLTQLTLKGCNLNCSSIGISQLPRTLKKLSLQGTKCFNMPMDKSFLFKIQDYLPELEELDVSECEWMEPATLLPLSKMPNLQTLLMRDCHKMSEFVAYASLATRYGFKELRKLDIRGCPVGDSEVSALGWVVKLSELHLSVSREPPDNQHSHRKGAARYYTELLDWELQEPYYFSSRAPSVESTRARRGSSSSEETTSRQLLAMRKILRPQQDSDVESIHSTSTGSVTVVSEVKAMVIDLDGHEDEGDNDNDDDGEAKNQKQEDTQEEEDTNKDTDNSRRYSLRSSRNTTENSAEDSSTFATPKPSKRKKVDNKSDKSINKNSMNGNKTVPKNKDYSTSKGVKNTETVANNTVSETIESDPKNTDNKVDSSIDNSPKNKADTSKKNETTYVSPQNNRVTRSNSKANPAHTQTGDATSSPYPSSSKASSSKASSSTIKASTSKPENTPTRKPENTPTKKPENTPTRTPENTPTRKLENTPTRRSLRSQSQSSKEDATGCNNSHIKTASKSNAANATAEKPAKSEPNKRKAENKSSEDESTPKKPAYLTRRAAAVNEGASTSKGVSNAGKSSNNTPKDKGKGKKTPPKSGANKKSTKDRNDSDSTSSDDEDAVNNREASREEPPQLEQFVRFRPHCPPELVRLPFVPVEGGEDEPLPPPEPRDRNLEPSHHLLYVNVGERFHAVYRLAPNRPAFGGMRSRARVSNLRNMFTSNPAHIDPAVMVTDAAIRGFGRSDTEDMNYVLIGPNGMRQQPRDGGIYNRLIGPAGQNVPSNQRPDRVALRTLTVTGYRHVTDRSLIHLSEAAPHLTHLDVRGTSVTEQGVENFRALRPDCEVLYGPFETEDVKKEEAKVEKKEEIE